MPPLIRPTLTPPLVPVRLDFPSSTNLTDRLNVLTRTRVALTIPNSTESAVLSNGIVRLTGAVVELPEVPGALAIVRLSAVGQVRANGLVLFQRLYRLDLTGVPATTGAQVTVPLDRDLLDQDVEFTTEVDGVERVVPFVETLDERTGARFATLSLDVSGTARRVVTWAVTVRPPPDKLLEACLNGSVSGAFVSFKNDIGRVNGYCRCPVGHNAVNGRCQGSSNLKAVLPSEGWLMLQANVGNANCPPFNFKLCRTSAEQAVREEIALTRPDLVVLQELLDDRCDEIDAKYKNAGRYTCTADGPPQVERILEGLDYGRALCAKKADGSAAYECTAARRGVLELSKVKQSPAACSTDTGHFSVLARPVGPGGRPFRVVNVHFDAIVAQLGAELAAALQRLLIPGNTARLEFLNVQRRAVCRSEQLQALFAEIQYSPLVVAAGDFNIDGCALLPDILHDAFYAWVAPPVAGASCGVEPRMSSRPFQMLSSLPRSYGLFGYDHVIARGLDGECEVRQGSQYFGPFDHPWTACRLQIR
ncbi:hypothetical protein V3W47_16625 [Deinococcus sp. YIM 134068]|uniref:hypothetical protein n=1 Tax=Deinococcus lichenicola TaxID=3118910 RepID=UPI002F921EC4